MMVAADPMVPKKKLKIKFGSQSIALEFGQQFSVINECGYKKSVNGSGQSESKLHKSVVHSSDGKRVFGAEYSRDRSSVPGGKKRGPEELIVDLQKKRQKMDRSMTMQCSAILKTLMKHRVGWVFNHPVDPVKLNIPDYFSIISEPMDLGTIKSKLEKNKYLDTEEFAADIRLTFSNAMAYNPPSSEVYEMAKVLKEVFYVRWKSLEEKWNPKRSKVGLGEVLNGQVKEQNKITLKNPKTPPSHNSLLLKRSKPMEEKVTWVSLDARPAVVTTKVGPPEPVQNTTCKFLGKSLRKGTGSDGGVACGSANAKPPLRPVAHKCGSCSSITCRCSLPSDSTHASSSDITFERSCRDHLSCSADASKLDYQAKRMSATQMSKSDPDSDGAVSSMDDENVCPSSKHTISATDVASGEEWRTPILDVQMSPKKVLRAAMLKSRFADTILKAQQKTLLDQSNKADPVKMQQEKERLERRHRAEKARIEAEIRATEAASRMRAEIELKRQRDREREAARIAILKMEKTVEIEENLEVLKELEMLCGCSLSYRLFDTKNRSEVVMRAYKGGAHLEHPLEQLGLFIKDDWLVNEEEAALNGDGEEGEIFS